MAATCLISQGQVWVCNQSWKRLLEKAVADELYLETTLAQTEQKRMEFQDTLAEVNGVASTHCLGRRLHIGSFQWSEGVCGFSQR